MILTTTSTLQDRHIAEYRGIVVGEAILGANIFKDLLASIRDIAMREMAERARHLGCNAVIGVDLDYETVGQNGSMLMVTASGTAVVVAG